MGGYRDRKIVQLMAPCKCSRSFPFLSFGFEQQEVYHGSSMLSNVIWSAAVIESATLMSATRPYVEVRVLRLDKH